MDSVKKDIFEFRKSIADNAEALVKYGQKSQKSMSINQMSLFDSEELEIEPIVFDKKDLSEFGLVEMAEKEKELLGIALTHDPYSEFILLEKTLCTSTLKDVVFAEDNTNTEIILCKISKVEKKTSKAGNAYYLLTLSRDGLETKAFLFGDDIKSNFSKITPNKIHIIKTMASGSMITIKKIDVCDAIDVSKYVGKILIELPSSLALFERIRNYIHFNMKKDNGLNLYFRYEGEVLDNPVFKVKVNNEDCNELVNLGCKIFIKRA